MILLVIPIFKATNLFLVFLYLWLFGMSMFGFGIFVGAFFSNGKTAAIVATMLFYLTSFLQVVVSDSTVSETNKTLSSLFPSVGVQLAGVNLIELEESGIGVTFENANDVYKNYRFGTCLWMLTLSFFIFTTLGLYLENILPGAVGVRKPFYYPFLISYWCGSSAKQQDQNEQEYEDKANNKVANSHEADALKDKPEVDPENFEDIPEFLKDKEERNQYLKITGLKKRFGSSFYAVNNLNAAMYEDEIFALLGHNGAGKTTAISVL
jgi:ATP-binding cassette subfamily A (ABC1) protein 3